MDWPVFLYHSIVYVSLPFFDIIKTRLSPLSKVIPKREGGFLGCDYIFIHTDNDKDSKVLVV